jgi:ribosomal protein L10
LLALVTSYVETIKAIEQQTKKQLNDLQESMTGSGAKLKVKNDLFKVSLSNLAVSEIDLDLM